MPRLFDTIDRYILGGFALVGLFLIVTHPTAVNGALRYGFGGINTGFKTLQGR